MSNHQPPKHPYVQMNTAQKWVFWVLLTLTLLGFIACAIYWGSMYAHEIRSLP